MINLSALTMSPFQIRNLTVENERESPFSNLKKNLQTFPIATDVSTLIFTFFF